MNNIILFDNFLNKNELNILTFIIKNKKWGYGHKSGYMEKVQNKFFSVKNSEDFFLKNIFDKIKKCVSKKLKINRHYMHIQTFGLDGSYHIDDSKLNTYTFCIYFSDIEGFTELHNTIINTKDNFDKHFYSFDSISKNISQIEIFNTSSKDYNNIIENASGEFFIKIPNEKHIVSIEPKNNRGIFFPSHYLHKGMAFNNFFNSVRLCITWKLEEII